MQLFVRLTDHEEITHKKIDLELDEKQIISSKLSIDLDREDLFFADGRQFPDHDCKTELPQIGLRHLDRVIVKHSLLSHWATFRRRYNLAQQAKQQHRIKADVEAALQHLKPLESASFFLCYPTFDSTVCDFSVEFAHIVDANEKYEHAANEYFSKVFNDNPEHPQVEIRCKPKESCGAQGGVICEIYKANVPVGKYHIKTHLGTANHSSHHTRPDLREIFVYRLLEAIKIGPEVHFLPNTHYSTFAIYIATKDVVGFRRALEARSEINSMHNLHLELLRRILYLTDLHSANYGLDHDNNLSVIDFQVDNHTRSADVTEFLHGNKEERIGQGKLCFTKWNLENVVEDVDKRLAVQKALFKEKRITFLPSTNYNEYLAQLSICSDRSEPTIGWVGSRPGVTCHYRTGQVLKTPTGALTLPGWYLICYVMPDGCQTCILDILCENEFMEACSDKYILSSSPISSNSSIDYWVQIGKQFPFAQSSSVELNVRNQRTKKFVTTEHMKAQVDTITNLTIHGLEPHEFYNVERCLRVKLPLALTSDARFTFSDDLKTNGSTFCSEEMFRTLRNSSQNPSTFLSLAIIFFFFSFGDNIAGKCGL